MTNVLSSVAKQKFFDNNGKPAAGYKLFTYAAGTATKLATSQDAGTGSPNTNPITLDFRGECNLWVPPNVAYKYVFAPPNDTDPPTHPIWTVDDIVDAQLVTLWGGVDTGFANAYVLDFVANFTAYQDGIVIYWLPSNTNTGASTINVNGLGPVPITNQDGSALYQGQLQANQVALIVYRGTGFALVATALLPTINVENSNYTFALSDANNIVENSTNDILALYTIPANATVAFAPGTHIDIVASGDGGITVRPAVGVTFYPFSSPLPGDVLVSGHASTRILKVSANKWVQFSQSNIGSFSGTFTPVWVGFSVPPTGVLSYYKIGNVVLLYNGTARVGTSNSTSMEITNCPSEIFPTALSSAVIIQDNGALANGMIGKTSLSTLQFYKGTAPPSLTGFTAASTKGLPAGFVAMWFK